MESVLRGSIGLSEFHTSLSNVHCVKVKQRYLTQLAALLFLSFMPRAKGFLANKAHLKVGWGYARRSS